VLRNEILHSLESDKVRVRVSVRVRIRDTVRIRVRVRITVRNASLRSLEIDKPLLPLLSVNPKPYTP